MTFKPLCSLVFPDLQLVRCPVCDLNTCDGKLIVYSVNILERKDKVSVLQDLNQ